MLLTEKISPADVKLSPFPYVVVDNVLPAELYGKLTECLPPLDVLTKGVKYGNNQRFNYSCTNIAFNPQINLEFKNFVQEHLSQSFLGDVLRVFEPAIKQYYPDLEKRMGPLKCGIRPVDGESDATVLMDVQLGVNTPSLLSGTTVRGPHIDCPRKLFVGLFYLRLPEDDSTGGDLQILERAAALVASGRDIRYDYTRTADPRDVQVVETVPYAPNRLVLLLNTRDSIHGVSCRSRSGHRRLFLNLLGEMRSPLFSLGGENGSVPLHGAGAVASPSTLSSFGSTIHEY